MAAPDGGRRSFRRGQPTVAARNGRIGGFKKGASSWERDPSIIRFFIRHCCAIPSFLPRWPAARSTSASPHQRHYPTGGGGGGGARPRRRPRPPPHQRRSRSMPQPPVSAPSVSQRLPGRRRRRPVHHRLHSTPAIPRSAADSSLGPSSSSGSASASAPSSQAVAEFELKSAV